MNEDGVDCFKVLMRRVIGRRAGAACGFCVDGMAAAGVDGFLVPRADRYQAKLCSQPAMSGWRADRFTGSAVSAAVLADVGEGVHLTGATGCKCRSGGRMFHTGLHWRQTVAGRLADQTAAAGRRCWPMTHGLHTVDEVAGADKGCGGGGESAVLRCKYRA